MNVTPVEKLFHLLDQSASLLKNEFGYSYLEALVDTGENIFQKQILQDKISELAKNKLKKYYAEIDLSSFQREEIRKAFQLAFLKGMKENVQPNHQMTPDSIGILIAYLIKKFVPSQSFSILDPAVGTGNLLLTILNQLPDVDIEAIGIDVDDLLIKLAYIHSNLLEHPVQLFNQDSLTNLLVDPVDVVVCDLPVGYYPNDKQAENFTLKADSGHSYAHHLFIEQSYRYAKKGAYLFLIVPNHLFESEEAPKLHTFIKEHMYIQGFLQLPISLFKNEKLAKSIIILQKKKDGIKPPKEVLLMNLPSLANKEALATIFAKFNRWLSENKK